MEDAKIIKKSKLIVPGSQTAINQLKYEIASDYGKNLDHNSVNSQSRHSTGGEITKRLIALATQSKNQKDR